MQDRAPTKENLALEAALCLELDKWLEREDLKWKQKSKELWIKEGDQNTRFFHLCTLVRRRRNIITEIREENGLRLINRKDIGEYFSTKFSEVFQSSSPNVPPNLDGLIEPCISA